MRNPLAVLKALDPLSVIGRLSLFTDADNAGIQGAS